MRRVPTLKECFDPGETMWKQTQSGHMSARIMHTCKDTELQRDAVPGQIWAGLHSEGDICAHRKPEHNHIVLDVMILTAVKC